MVTEMAGPRIWVNTDPLWIGHDLETNNSNPLDRLRLGLVRRYQLHFVINSIFGYERLNVDQLGAGLLGFQSDPDGLHPQWASYLEGLRISINRPQQVIDHPVNHFAAINVAGTVFNATRMAFLEGGRFVLMATFRRPVREMLHGFADGTWAPALLLETVDKNSQTEFKGVTCQFRPTGTRMNLPNTGAPSRPDLPASAVLKLMDPVNPSPFTLILSYNSAATPSGSAFFLADQEIVDSASFDFAVMNDVRVVNKVLIGVGAAGGGGYKAQVDLLDVQIWLPAFPII